MQFHVLGLGPIGSLIAHNLRRYLPRDTRVTLIVKNREQAVRRPSMITVEQNGVVTNSSDYFIEAFDHHWRKRTTDVYRPRPRTRRTEPDPPAIPRPKLVKYPSEPITSLIVTAKAHQTVAAIQQIQSRLTAHSTIVLLQNGMGVYEELCEQVFRNPDLRPHIILASNNHGAYQLGDRTIHAGVGSLELGIVPDHRKRNFEAQLNDPTNHTRQLRLDDITTAEDSEHEAYASLRSTLAGLLSLQQLNVSWKPISALQLAMRQKVVANAVINPLTAVLRCRNGDIFNTQAGLDINAQVCAEASRGFIAQIKAETAHYLKEMDREGYSGDPGRIPPSLLETSLEQEVLRVSRITAGNKSSMLNDIEKGKETEIDYINGYLLRLGTQFNVPMPTVQNLYNMVKLRSAIPIDQML